MTTGNKEFTAKICAAAKEYTEMGFSCFPLSLGKRPLAKWKQYQSEYPLEETIDDWQDKGAPRTDSETGEIIGHEPVFNLAIVTGAISGVVVVDCDNEEALKYANEHNLTSPIRVKTRRGMHYYFRHPGGDARFRNKAGNKPTDGWPKVDGLDFRGDGGYVVAPPSISLNPDDTLKHSYTWDNAEGIDLDDMPVWRGNADDTAVDLSGDFDLASLSLANVDIGESAMDVREQVKTRVDFLGRKLTGPDKGDATDDWMIRFAGQMVRRGLTGPELWDAIVNFHDEFFVFLRSRNELERWLKTKMRSAIQMDRRNHPDDYDDKGVRIKEQPASAVISFQPIYSADFKRLLDTLGDTQYHADPVVPSRSIIQVVGYNGHGKSFFVGGLATAMAANRAQFGPFFLPKPSKVFYLDFDNPARTVLNRFTGFAKVHGDPHHNLPIWSPAIIPPDAGGYMNLREAAGLATLEKWMEQIRPDVVVIDTVRNGFGGLDEKNPQDWFHVNRVAKILRDRYHASVILVHHRNKPTADGLGREAGSTAQLTDLDTQVIVTQVYKDKHVAKVKAGLFDDDCSFERKTPMSSTITTPFAYFQQKMTNSGMATSHRVRMVTEIAFGKVREETDLHRTYYLGYIEDINTGAHDMLWTPSPREDAMAMYSSGQYTPQAIAQFLFIPMVEIKKWLNIP